MTVKIEAMSGDLAQPFAYGNVFVREEVGGHPRLRVGVDDGQDTTVAALARGLRGPFQLLYVYCIPPGQVPSSVGTRALS